MVFGPSSEQNFSRKMPAKMSRKAFYQALSLKVSEKALFVISDFTLEKPSTKALQAQIDSLGIEYRSALLVLAEPNKNVRLSARNLPDLHVEQIGSLSTYSVLQAGKLIMTESALKQLQGSLKTAESAPKTTAKTVSSRASVAKPKKEAQ